MRLSETREAFADRLTFPIDRETVIERVGDVTLDAPNGENTTVAAVLDRSDPTTYESVEELHDTLVGLVDDAFIGRKYYDDRGDQTGIPTDQESF
ncbi:DUF5789 family protein [Halobaculum magnesiiphilum]|uniref:DUF5789 family protein n=1 Tax=Halobaculum magnesiiphilum TaxID=1017351 RepID=A0A8T8WF21_9EURY|nr:DUF5789 family protein [Halobaculum magnesiiphilum]QZP38482.1 DUF5789 family protein [Halobaculum magnesiiphilum]